MGVSRCVMGVSRRVVGVSRCGGCVKDSRCVAGVSRHVVGVSRHEVGVSRCVVGVSRCVVGVLTAVTSSGGADTSNTDTQSKSFYGNSTPQPTRPPVNNVRVYNGGAPVGFVDTPTNIHPIASLTPYQNRFLYLLSVIVHLFI